jgi:hypothetical protein
VPARHALLAHGPPLAGTDVVVVREPVTPRPDRWRR